MNDSKLIYNPNHALDHEFDVIAINTPLFHKSRPANKQLTYKSTNQSNWFCLSIMAIKVWLSLVDDYKNTITFIY